MMWRKKQKNFVPLALLLLLILGVLVSDRSGKGKASVYERADVLMGTSFHGTVYGGSKEVLPALAKELENLETKRLSWREETSEIGQINLLAGKEPYKNITPELSGYLTDILDIADKSGGALDPTIGNVSRLWDFGGGDERLPMPEEIAMGLEKTGWEKLVIAENSVFLPEGMSLDLGAAGKGIGVDRAAEFIKSQEGIEGAVIALGGSIALIGSRPDKAPWRLAIANPRGIEGEVLGVLKLSGECFISTSGDYEKYFMEGQKRYHHILNPKTGYPAESGLISVTVVCDSGLESDGLSTACFVLGLDEGMKLLKEYGAEGVFVDEEKNVYVTEGLKTLFHLKSNSYQIAE